jgi:hypothetical protein
MSGESALALPMFASQIVGRDVKALFAFPLRVNTHCLGTLTMYRARAGRLDRQETDAALALAALATLVVLELPLPNPSEPRTYSIDPAISSEGEPTETGSAALGAQTGSRRGRSTRHLWPGAVFTSQSVLHKATGVLMVEWGTDAALALARLRGYAFATGQDLIAVATDVVEGRLATTQLDR